jgi:hypothetical protein
VGQIHVNQNFGRIHVSQADISALRARWLQRHSPWVDNLEEFGKLWGLFTSYLSFKQVSIKQTAKSIKMGTTLETKFVVAIATFKLATTTYTTAHECSYSYTLLRPPNTMLASLQVVSPNSKYRTSHRGTKI